MVLYCPASPSAPCSHLSAQVVLAAVRQNGFSLGSASRLLRGDEEVCLAAVEQYGMALFHATPKIKGNREIVRIPRRFELLCLLWATQIFFSRLTPASPLRCLRQ